MQPITITVSLKFLARTRDKQLVIFNREEQQVINAMSDKHLLALETEISHFINLTRKDTINDSTASVQHDRQTATS